MAKMAYYWYCKDVSSVYAYIVVTCISGILPNKPNERFWCLLKLLLLQELENSIFTLERQIGIVWSLIGIGWTQL